MDSTTNLFLSLITALGFGGVLGALVQTKLQQRNQVAQHEHALKQKRYLCIVGLMLAKLRPQINLPKIQKIRPDLKDDWDIDDELEAELLNAYVYASDAVICALSDFIQKPEKPTFVFATSAMRKHLWGRKTSVGRDLLEAFPIITVESA